MTETIKPAWIMTKTPKELDEHYRRQAATVYPVALSHEEYCAVIAASAILFDIVCGIRYTHKPQLKRIEENVVDVLRAIARRAETSAVPPIEPPI